MDEMDDLLSGYFGLGLSQKEILFCLAQRHGIVLSLRHLKRLLNRKGLYRRKYKSDILDVALFIEEALSGSGQLNGYRWMHRECLKNGFVVSQQDVRFLLHILDPEGVKFRSKRRLRRRRYGSRGPNWCWHIDAYDKLSPYGIGISGSIDGFSRYIVWLEAYHTNSDPRIIAGYFIKAVQSKNGCPALVRTDRGTENGHIHVMQTFLRKDHVDSLAGERSFRYGQSIANQRIEGWWSVLRKECIQYWMNVLGKLKDDGHFTGDWLDKNLIRFCFLSLVQFDLNKIVCNWNVHRIASYRNMDNSVGKPFLLYHTPEIYGRHDQLMDVEQNAITACADECLEKDYPCDRDVFEVCCILMYEQGLLPPRLKLWRGSRFVCLFEKYFSYKRLMGRW